MEYGLIGEHLPHSFSKEIHGLLAPYTYDLCELAPDELAGFMEKRNFRGINVTIPYKQAVIPFLDDIDETAAAIGAVNTVVNRDGKLYGYNTDYDGLILMIRRAGIDIVGKKVLIFGTGGTAQTSTAVCRAMGAADIRYVSRTPDGTPIRISREVAYTEHADTDIVINTTPLGMYPQGDVLSVDLNRFPSCSGVVDIIYNPLQTPLMLDAAARGIPATGGLYMLVAQAAKASSYFTGDAAALDMVDAVYDRIIRQKQNIVLIGVPSCGKSTVGAQLAEHLGRPFTDTDAMITARAGVPIPEIFAQKGETAFRDLESEAVAACSVMTGQVIATGGGAVLRPQNVRRLKQNGVLIFLDRPLEQLMPTDDRPLSGNREALEKRYHERYPLYCRVADRTVSVTTVEETVRQIEKDWL